VIRASAVVQVETFSPKNLAIDYLLRSIFSFEEGRGNELGVHLKPALYFSGFTVYQTG